ncbi:MAG: hypothetical protein AAFX09_08870 [Pseudomonadota bacterium]
MNRTVAVIQARTGSSRLPGKVLMPIRGSQSILDHQCRRLKTISGVNELVIATTEAPADDDIAAIGRRHGVRVVRGSTEDVLSRFVTAARLTLADTLVRITSDSPLRDPWVIERCVAHHHEQNLEYTRPAPGALPKGMRAEVIQASVLRQIDSDPDTTPREREHVTVRIREHPDRYRTGAPDFPERLAHPDFDLSVDTLEDLRFVRGLQDELAARGWAEDVHHICQVLEDGAAERIRARA